MKRRRLGGEQSRSSGREGSSFLGRARLPIGQTRGGGCASSFPPGWNSDLQGVTVSSTGALPGKKGLWQGGCWGNSWSPQHTKGLPTLSTLVESLLYLGRCGGILYPHSFSGGHLLTRTLHFHGIKVGPAAQARSQRTEREGPRTLARPFRGRQTFEKKQ